MRQEFYICSTYIISPYCRAVKSFTFLDKFQLKKRNDFRISPATKNNININSQQSQDSQQSLHSQQSQVYSRTEKIEEISLIKNGKDRGLKTEKDDVKIIHECCATMTSFLAELEHRVLKTFKNSTAME